MTASVVTTPSGRAKALHRILDDLVSRSTEIQGAALLSEDGLLLARALPADIEEARISGVAVMLYGAAAHACRALERQALREAIVRGEDGYAVMLSGDGGTQLLCLTASDARLGLVSMDMRRSAAQIATYLRP